MIYSNSIENKYEDQVEVIVNFDMGENGVEINSIHDLAGNDVEPYDIESLEALIDEFFFDMAAENARKGRYSFNGSDFY